MSDWFKQVRENTDNIVHEIKNHPFIKGLIAGSLPKDVFQFYINQDALYLAEYKKVLATVGIKCHAVEETQFFLDAATGILAVEDALHKTYIKDLAFNTVPSPTCELYTSYLARITANHSLSEGLAAVLPCFTVYKEIGDYIQANQNEQANNPYQSWIDTYGGIDFENSVNKAIAITNKYAQSADKETLNNMELSFTKSTKLEWLFWDSAFKKEAWKI
ncbi:thiaminase II [Putridiphycobacter roseus]|uniref:Aminopyrimidine aminohydrolase n=1 Tax=Putridiphycobacter roseus TaxID=2219161 RepID=A0A2W1N025_9FLAO|nr:thiaminase II [Putridiphycobacter roseus]PZE17547.1 thiaminase II [Putridiphycobacter roseus]